MGGLIIDYPVYLSTALDSDRILPGDVLLLRTRRTYTGDYTCNWSGTKALPVTIKPYGDGPVIVDGTFKFGEHTHVYDIDFTDTRPNRLFQYYGESADEGVAAYGAGIHLHGCSIAQQHTSGVSWMGSEGDGEGEISENVFLLNGCRYADGTGHGHSLYTHNNAGGARVIQRNSFFRNLGHYTLQILSDTNLTPDYAVQNNAFMWSMICAGFQGPQNLQYKSNTNFYGYVYIAKYMGFYTCDGITIDGNTLITCEDFSLGGDPGILTNTTETNNIVYGGNPSDRVGYAFTDKPATWTNLTAFTKSTRWKGMLEIYNRDSAATVAVDFSSVLAAGSYRLLNTQNLAETWEFEYTSGSVNVPTNFTAGEY